MLNRKNKNRAVSSILTILVIGLLIYSGPGLAMDIIMSITDTTGNTKTGFDPGETAVFNLNISIPLGELVPVKGANFTITDSGGNPHTCFLDLNGGNNIDCGVYIINVSVIPYTNCGYGYGYTWGYGYGYRIATYG